MKSFNRFINESWSEGQYDDRLRYHAEKIVRNKFNLHDYTLKLHKKWRDKANYGEHDDLKAHMKHAIQYETGGKQYLKSKNANSND